MAKIDILWTDIRYTQWFNILVDFPIKYEDFSTDKTYSDIREYIDKNYYYMLMMLIMGLPNSFPKETGDRIFLFLNYDIEDYYKNILWYIYDILWNFVLWITITEEEKQLYLDKRIKDWNYDDFCFILDMIKTIWNGNKVFPKDRELSIDLIKLKGWMHKKYIIRNSHILWDKQTDAINDLKKEMKTDKDCKTDYYKMKKIFKQTFSKQEIHKNQILNYIFFLFFLWKDDLFISLRSFTNSIYLCDNTNLYKCIWEWSTVINIKNIAPFYDKDSSEHIKNKYQNFVKNDQVNTNILDKILEDIKKLIEKTKTWQINIEYKDFKPAYMSWLFKTTELWKYQELKDYTWDYWYIATKNHNWRASLLVWEKLFKYTGS